jgi:hypothetical protein
MGVKRSMWLRISGLGCVLPPGALSPPWSIPLDDSLIPPSLLIIKDLTFSSDRGFGGVFNIYDK